MRKISICDSRLSSILAIFVFVIGLGFTCYGANFAVNSAADSRDANPGDGICADAGGGCTLRAAVEESNALPAVQNGNFVFLNFADRTVINLTLGALVVSSDVNILGLGARQLTVQRSAAPGTPNFRVFTLFKPITRTAPVIVNINGIEIANGATASGGGGIYVPENCLLALFDVAVRNNIAIGSTGGGVRTNGTVYIIRSLIADNSASEGGGLNNQPGSITVVENSTFTRNRAVGSSSSGSQGLGGGIANLAQIRLNNVTVSRNESAIGGGFVTSGANNFLIRNTIIAGNTAPVSPDVRGFFSTFGNNFVGINDGTTSGSLPAGNPNTDGDRVGTPAAPLDPLLGPLRNNGGQTDTLALLAGSQAIDGGSNCVADRSCAANNPLVPMTTDQRSNGFARPVGSVVDIGAFERQPNDRGSSAFFDYDGDGRADVSVFRPSNGAWYLQQSRDGFTGTAFGQANDKLVPADYDGDGETDVAVYRNGIWYLQRSATGFAGIGFGDGNDIPVPADYDGDGRAELAVFRPSNGYWYILNLTTNQFTGTLFGISGDKPIPADYDGDGKADIAVNRNGTWYLQRSQLGFTGIQFGDENDKVVPSDYDGDGKADIAVFRPSNGGWYLLQSTAGFTGSAFGLGTDIPVAADYDGDGKADLAVVRNGVWYLNRTTQGFAGIQFGNTTDLFTPNTFVR